MKIFSYIAQSALLITTPALMASWPQEFAMPVMQTASYQPIEIPDLRTASYDEVIDLLSEIESDSFEERCSFTDLEKINQLISFLAMEGAAENNRVDVDASIATLFQQNFGDYAYRIDSNPHYIQPTLFKEGSRDVILCKSWNKMWDSTKKFVKKHKKEIIIGVIIVIAVTVAVITVVDLPVIAAGAATGAAASLEGSSNTPNESPNPKVNKNSSYASNESFVTSLESQVTNFREMVAPEQFAAAPSLGGISMEENGRIMGSLFTHHAIDQVTHDFAYQSFPSSTPKGVGLYSQSPTPKWLQTYPDSFTVMPHPSADLAFSTDYTTSIAGDFTDLNASVYQARGNLALHSECYAQAVQDFGKAISLDPGNPSLYLERGIANFELGNYEQSIADYHEFVEKNPEPFSVTDFSLGFAKGIPLGVYESGKGALLFLSDFVTHPVQTSKQVVDALSQLATLVKNDEFGLIAESLSPELHHLVVQWDTLSSETRGELAGYAVGKLGTDLLAPGAVAKVASKSAKSAQELVAVYKNLQLAQETLVLETAAGMKIPAKVGEIVEMGKKSAMLGEEFGFTAQEINQLQKAGKLEGAINTRLDRLVSQSESEVFKAAMNKGSHVKMVRDYLNKPAKEIQKGIKSYEKQIALHQEKIENPSKFIPHWNELHPQRQHALINKKWPAEIQCYTEQRDMLQSILNERVN